MLGAVLVGGAGFSAFRGKVAALLVVLVLLTGMTSVSYAADNQKSVAGDAPMSLTIGELTTNPQLYVGKEVTVIARVVGICEEDGCLTLKDKTDVIEGVPPEGGFKKNPEAGSTLRVTGTVKMKKGEVHIDVKSFEEVKK